MRASVKRVFGRRVDIVFHNVVGEICAHSGVPAYGQNKTPRGKSLIRPPPPLLPLTAPAATHLPTVLLQARSPQLYTHTTAIGTPHRGARPQAARYRCSAPKHHCERSKNTRPSAAAAAATTAFSNVY